MKVAEKNNQTSLEEISQHVVEVVLSEQFIRAETLKPRVKAVLSSFMRRANAPKYLTDKLTDSERGRYIQANHIMNMESNFWKHQLKELVGKEAMQSYYDKLDERRKEII